MSDSRKPELQAVIISLLVLCVITVGLRCYTMQFIVKRFAIEDWLAVVTLAFHIAFSTFALLSVHYGLGQHLSDVPPANRSVAFMWRHFATWAYIAVSTLTKFVVGLFLLRICSHIRWMRIMIWTMLAVVGVFNTFYFFLDIFSAQPISYYWLRYAPNPPTSGRVNDEQWATIPTYIASLLNVIVDWALAILPMILLWNARLDRRTKFSVCAVLALGSLASIATIVRIPYAGRLLENSDYLYNFSDFGIWSAVEIGIALSASSLGALRPLLRKLNLLSDPKPIAQSYFGGSEGPYNSGQHRGAGPGSKAPLSSAVAVDDGLDGRQLTKVAMEGVADGYSPLRGGTMQACDLGRFSECDIELSTFEQASVPSVTTR